MATSPQRPLLSVPKVAVVERFNSISTPVSLPFIHVGQVTDMTVSCAFSSLICSWKRLCVQHEDLDKFWYDPDSSLDFYQLKDQHFAAVDAVHIMNSANLCISGSRDRTVGVWSLSALADPNEPEYAKKSFRQALDGHRVCNINLQTFYGCMVGDVNLVVTGTLMLI